MKRFIMLLVAAVLLGGVIGGTLIGGIAIGKSQGREEITQEMQDRTSQFTSRFGQDGTTEQPTGMTPPAGAGMFVGRGGTIGTVGKIEGGIITLTTPTGSVSVITSSSTTVQKMDSGSITDIKIGDSISVSGESQDDGSIQATSIFINLNTGTSK
ncbi:MAG TPA: hypothetical protein VGA85_05235 [Dehalococcoidales bacterium]